MKIQLIWSFCIFWQASLSSIHADRRVVPIDDEVTESLVTTTDQAEQDAGNHLGSIETERLSEFHQSTLEITKASASAKVGLQILKDQLGHWLQDQADAGKEGLYEEFWEQVLTADEPILKPNELHRSSDSLAGTETQDDTICPLMVTDCLDWTLKYRSCDGTCNNQKDGFTQWGSAGRAQSRMIYPDYADGIGEPRKAKSKNELPSAREVARQCFPMESSPNNVNTVLLMTIGQFLDHDITHTPTATFLDSNGEMQSAMCEADGCGTGDCFPIIISNNDPMFSQFSCMNFIRSAPVLDDNCKPSPRQQANSNTAWIDASQLYGSSITKLMELRDPQSPGGMKFSPNPVRGKKPLLPYDDNENSPCSGLNDVVHCFNAGDVRRNEQVGLTSLHTLFLRLHNSIRDKLRHLNPGWGAEKLFQETRRLVGALWQHIIYNEYLPTILGKKITKEYNLQPGCNPGYNNTLRPDIYNVFSTAAYRFGHNQIPNNFTFADYTMKHYNTTPLSNVLFDPTTLFYSPKAGVTPVDSCVLGMVASHSESFDGNFAEQISNHLFTENPPFGFGFDLRALNLQRGRDHGIPAYVEWRKLCNLQVADNFTNLQDMKHHCREKFSTLYESVEDIDLYAGGSCEMPVEGGVVGPTFACIIAKQFHVLKFGDRFFYENNHSGFTSCQQKEIKKYTISRLLCDTLDHVKHIQPYALWQPYSKLSSSDKNKYLEDYENMDWNKRVCCDWIRNIQYWVFSY